MNLFLKILAIILIITSCVIVFKPNKMKTVLFSNGDVTLNQADNLADKSILQLKNNTFDNADLKVEAMSGDVQDIRMMQVNDWVKAKETAVNVYQSEQLQNQSNMPELDPIDPQVAKQDIEKIRKEYKNEIIWNQWHADVNNTLSKRYSIEIEKQLNYAITFGATYAYKFNVDKNGHISDIYVTMLVPSDSPYVKEGARVLLDTISKMEKTKVLTYPAKSRRNIVTVQAVIRFADTERAVSANDFSDYEKIQYVK